MIYFQDIKPATWGVIVSFLFLSGAILYLGYSSKGGIKQAHWIAIIVIAGGVATLYKELKSSETTQAMRETGESTNAEVKTLRNENAELKGEVIDLKKLLSIQSQAITIVQGQNAELTAQAKEIHTETQGITTRADSIHNQTSDIQANITGGDSYCYLSFFPMKGHILVTLHHVGKDPLRELTIKFLRGKFYPIETDKNFRNPEPIGNIGPPMSTLKSVIGIGFSEIIGRIPVTDDEKFIFWSVSFEINGGQKKWFQRVVFQSRPPTRKEPIIGYNNPLAYVYQVYTVDKKIEYNDSQFQGKPIQQVEVKYFKQQILNECESPENPNKVDWSQYHHQSGYRSYPFTETIYLPGAHDCHNGDIKKSSDQ